jgi:hypothetical protein
MDTNEALDREVIIERAEAVRSWLAGIALSNRATGALDRELAGIIADDPGGYINGRRPLAGLTIDDLIAELNLPNAGAVGQVRGVGDRIIADLRAAIAPDGELGAATATAVLPPAQETAEAALGNGVVPDEGALAAQAAAEAPQAAAMPDAPQPARRGRPRRKAPAEPEIIAAQAQPAATAAPPTLLTPEADARNGQPPAADQQASGPQGTDLVTTAPAETVQRPRRGRPRKVDMPAPAVAPPAAAPISRALAPRLAEAAPQPLQVVAQPAPTLPLATADDPTLEQITRLWPTLHPQARRAVVLYVSMLLVEI